MLGLTTINVNRTLRGLKDEGLFSINHHELTILNYEAFCGLVDSELDNIWLVKWCRKFEYREKLLISFMSMSFFLGRSGY